MTNNSRMPLRRRQHVFDAVVDQLDRPARFQRRQRRVAGDHRWIFFLSAESAAGFRLHDANTIARETEQHSQRAVHVVRTLHGSIHGDAEAVLRGDRDDAVRFDVELLLRADAIFAFDDLVGIGKARVEIAFVDGERLEHQRRCGRVVVRRRGPVVDVDVRRQQAIAILVRQNQNRLSDVTDRPLGQARLVLLDERDDVASGNVACVDDGEAGGVEVEGDVGDVARGNRRANRPRVQQIGEREVVDIAGRAGHLVAAVLTKHVPSDGLAHLRL